MSIVVIRVHWFEHTGAHRPQERSVPVPRDKIEYYSDGLLKNAKASADGRSLDISTDERSGPSKAIPGEKLVFMLEAIRASRLTRRADLETFEDVLEFSRLIWKYQCRPILFKDLADKIKDKFAEVDLNRDLSRNMAGWAFIALVFDWLDVFEAAAVDLVNASESGSEFYEKYIPKKLNLTDSTNTLTEKMFKHIQASCWQMYRRFGEATFRRIVLHLERSRVFLTESVRYSPALTNMTPGQLVSLLHSAIDRKPSTTDIIEPLPAIEENGISSNGESHARGEFGEGSTTNMQNHAGHMGSGWRTEELINLFKSNHRHRKIVTVRHWDTDEIGRWDSGTEWLMREVAGFRLTEIKGICNPDEFKELRKSNLKL